MARPAPHGLLVAGLMLQIAGLALDGALHGADPHLAEHEGPLSLSNPGHLAMGAGFGLTLLGTAAGLLRASSRRLGLAVAAMLCLAAAGSVLAGQALMAPARDAGALDRRVVQELRTAARHGTDAALRRLEALAAGDPAVARLRHTYVHLVGRLAARGDVDAAFRACHAARDSGCYHGVIRAHFERRMHLDPQRVRRFCAGHPVHAQARAITAFQCLHGVGHGLVAFFGGDLERPLRHCDLLRLPLHRRHCYGGVFMEARTTHGHGGSGEPRPMHRLMSRCRDVRRRQRWTCHVYAAAVASAADADVRAALRRCDAARPPYAAACYQGVGAHLTVVVPDWDMRRVAAACRLGAPSYTGQCLRGAVLNVVGVFQATGTAMELCRSAPAAARGACRDTVEATRPDLQAQ